MYVGEKVEAQKSDSVEATDTPPAIYVNVVSKIVQRTAQVRTLTRNMTEALLPLNHAQAQT